MIACSVCGTSVEELVHRWVVASAPDEGTLDMAMPKKVWFVTAPLYYRSTEDFMAASRVYCGAECATKDGGR